MDLYLSGKTSRYYIVNQTIIWACQIREWHGFGLSLKYYNGIGKIVQLKMLSSLGSCLSKEQAIAIVKHMG